MSFLKLFAGKTPEAHEQKGDTLCEARHWGKAKIAFERALEKLERVSAPDAQSINRIQEKIGQTKESLARRHHHTVVHPKQGGALDGGANLLH